MIGTKRCALLAVVLAFAPACGAVFGESFDNAHPRTDGGPSIDSADGGTETGRADVELPVPVGPDGTCADDRKRCDDLCVSRRDPNYGCGAATCTVCSAPANSAAQCNADTCDFTCASGYAKSGAQCVPSGKPVVDSPWTCNESLLSDSELRQRIPAGAPELELPDIQFEARYRDCFAATGCSAWQNPTGSGRTSLVDGQYHSNNRTMIGRIRSTTLGSLSLVSISYKSPPKEASLPIHDGWASGRLSYVDHAWANGYQAPFIETDVEAEFATTCVAIRLATEKVALSNGATREWEFGARVTWPEAAP